MKDLGTTVSTKKGALTFDTLGVDKNTILR
jgi:hypothetical protein